MYKTILKSLIISIGLLALFFIIIPSTVKATLTVGATSVVSDAALTLQGTSVSVTGNTTISGVLSIPVGASSIYGHLFANSVLSDLVRRTYLSYNMSPTSTYNSFNLDDASRFGTLINTGDFAGGPGWGFQWADAGSNPVTPLTVLSVSASSTASSINNGLLWVGSSSTGAGTGGIVIAGGSGIGLSLNTPGSNGYLYPVSASTLGIGFSGGFTTRPTSPVISFTTNAISIGVPVTFGPATTHVISSQTTAPTASVTGSGYGSASMGSGSTDTKGTITATVGAAAGTLVVTFQTAYASAPVCTVTPATATAQVDVIKMYVTSETGVLTLNFVATPTGGSETWNYICMQ